jgi:hypothetical protein
MSASFAKHIWPEAWKLLSQKSPDMSGPRVEGYKRGSHTPSNPSSSILSPLHLLAPPSPPKVIFGSLHQIPLVSRGFASPNLHDIQIIVRFPLSKVY